MTVLIVDDEMIIREGLKNALHWESHGVTEVETASSGSKALEKIASRHFDIVITDIKMPKMTGLEFAEQLQALSPDTKVIILSGFAEFEYAQKAVSLNVMSYLLKPVNIEELEALIKKIYRETGSDSGANALVEKAKDYVRRNYARPLSTKEVAEYLERNPDYFSNIFKKVENVSFTEYLNRVRIKKAQHLLSATSMYTYEIAEKTGYTDYRYFTQVFKKATGMSPSQYRERNPGPNQSIS